MRPLYPSYQKRCLQLNSFPPRTKTEHAARCCSRLRRKRPEWPQPCASPTSRSSGAWRSLSSGLRIFSLARRKFYLNTESSLEDWPKRHVRISPRPLPSILSSCCWEFRRFELSNCRRCSLRFLLHRKLSLLGSCLAEKLPKFE